jgi:hypothetical protein
MRSIHWCLENGKHLLQVAPKGLQRRVRAVPAADKPRAIYGAAKAPLIDCRIQAAI